MFSSRSFLRDLAQRLVLLTVFLSILAAALNAQTRVPARSADEFVDSMGVNVHFEYSNSAYKHYAALNQKLALLGMRHVRDEINNTTNKVFVAQLQQLHTIGYTLCGLIEGGSDYPRAGHKLQASLVVPMIQNLLPSIDAVEGPNEPDDPTPLFVYDTVPYPQGAIKESEDLWNIVKGAPAIRSLPVLAMSEGTPQNFTQLAAITPPPIDYADFGNMHSYQGGLVGNDQLTGVYIPYARVLTGAAPLWTTEMGYHNNTQFLNDGEQQGVSERASAIYLPIAFLSGFNQRIVRTFSYELIDEYYDPDFKSGRGDAHYGLLRFDGEPKVAFTAVQNLIAIVREPAHQDFDPGALDIAFSGAPSTMHYTLLQKSTGDYYLAIWNDVQVYQLAASTITPGYDLYPEDVPVTITLPGAYEFTVYAPNDSSGEGPTGAYTISTTKNSIQLKLPPKVLIIRITAAG